MLEKKFRAWAKGYNCWCYRLDYIDGVWLGYVKKDGREYSTTDLIIEQYTGLKDKNGKEIYGWDIVQRGANHVAIIKWSEANARFIAIDVESRRLMSFDDWTATHELVIIGNARENPELLEGEK